MDQVLNANDVVVLKMLQQPDFSQNALRIQQVFESTGYFFNSNFGVVGRVSRCHDNTVRAVPNWLDQLVSLIDDELCALGYKCVQTILGMIFRWGSACCFSSAHCSFLFCNESICLSFDLSFAC